MRLLKVLFLGLLITGFLSSITNAEELVLQPGPEGKDTFITTATPNDNYSYMAQVVFNIGGSTEHGLIEFDISALPADVTINSATLELLEYANGDSCQYNMNSMELHLNQASWVEDLVTWNNAPAYGPAIVTNAGETTACEWLLFDVTSAVTDWYSGSTPNYGFRITGPSGGDALKYIWSSDTGNAADRPILRINYTPPSSQAIPTLSEWGMIIFALLTAVVAVVFLRRRNMTA